MLQRSEVAWVAIDDNEDRRDDCGEELALPIDWMRVGPIAIAAAVVSIIREKDYYNRE